MTADDWLDQYYSGEFFSGRFDFLKSFIKKHNLDDFDSIITIGGTNGKGETSRCLSKIFTYNNIVHGLWTSPHLKTVLERFCFSHNDDLQHTEVIEVFFDLKKLCDEDNTKLSYFEFLFISFLMLAKKKLIKILILEVGLGGRLDAVNALDATICGITSISRDHQDLLGNRYELILKEKLGIIRDNCTIYTSFENDYLRRKTKEYLKDFKLHWVDLFEVEVNKKEDDFSSRNHALAKQIAKSYFQHKLFRIPEFNLTALRGFGVIDSVSFSLFPSHNPDGMRKLVQLLVKRNYTYIDLMVLSFSERSDEDIETMIRSLKRSFSCPMILFHFHHFKAAKREKLERIGKKFNLNITNDTAFFNSINYSHKQHLLFTGSNYFLGHIMQKLNLSSSI